MSDFDPYHRWLGIRDAGRPPNHYRLLGLDLFEPDPRLIAAAADRQMGHVRNFQTGQQSNEATRLLNELSTARVCLLHPVSKADYDQRLRAALGLIPPLAAAPASPAAVAPAEPAVRWVRSQPAGPTIAAEDVTETRRRRRRVSPWVAGAVVVWSCVLVGGIVYVVSQGPPAELPPGDPAPRFVIVRPKQAAPPATPVESSPGAPAGVEAVRTIAGPTAGVWSLAFSPDGALLASGGADRTVRVWNVKDGTQRQLRQAEDVVPAVAFAPDGKQVLYATSGRPIAGWAFDEPAASVEERLRLEGAPTTIAFAPTAPLVAVGNETGDVLVSTWPEGADLRRIVAQAGAVRGLAFSGQGGWPLATTGADSTVRVWMAQDIEPTRQFSTGQGGVWAVALDRTHKRLFAAGVDGTVREFAWPAGTPGAVRRGHTRDVRGLAVSADGKWLASVGRDESLRLWPLPLPMHQGEPPAALVGRGHRDAVLAVTFAPAGDIVATASADGTVRLWRVPGVVTAPPVVP